MARPKGIWTPEIVRQRIQTTKLTQRLEKHALGKVEMSATQVRAAEVLLARTLPTLTQTDLSIEGTLGIADISDRPLTTDEWNASASDHLEAAAGTAKAPH